MSFAAPDPDMAAELSAVVGNVEGLALCHSKLGGGVEMITATWPGRKIILEKLIQDVAWNAFGPALDDAVGEGVTPADALKAALEQAYTNPYVQGRISGLQFS